MAVLVKLLLIGLSQRVASAFIFRSSTTNTVRSHHRRPEDLVTAGGRQLVQPCFRRGCAAWRDTEGNRIEAHGGGVLRSPRDGRWYWYGESAKLADVKRATNGTASGGSVGGGINCYSADGLEGPWKNEGKVLAQADIRLRGTKGPFVVERPKVIYNNVTLKYVMWFHLDSSSYMLRHVGVATAEHPAGPFHFRRGFQPDGLASLDMSLFHDYDGQAYFVRSVNNRFFAISRISPDFMTTTGVLSQGDGYISGDRACLEGFAMFRYPFSEEGKIFMMTSHCYYWKPNPLLLLRSDGPDLADPQWKDIGNPTHEYRSWNSQPNFVVEYEAEDGEKYPVYMGDNWIHAGPRGLQDASYVWLPLQVQQDWTVNMSKLLAWDMRNPNFQEHSWLQNLYLQGRYILEPLSKYGLLGARSKYF